MPAKCRDWWRITDFWCWESKCTSLGLLVTWHKPNQTTYLHSVLLYVALRVGWERVGIAGVILHFRVLSTPHLLSGSHWLFTVWCLLARVNTNYSSDRLCLNTNTPNTFNLAYITDIGCTISILFIWRSLCWLKLLFDVYFRALRIWSALFPVYGQMHAGGIQ